MEAMQTVTDILAQRAREADNYIISLNNRRLDLAVQDICKFNVHLVTRNNKPAEPAVVKPPSNIVSKKTRSRNVVTSNSGTSWSVADNNMLIELVNENVRNGELASLFGRSVGSIQCQLTKLGMGKTNRPIVRTRKRHRTVNGNMEWTTADEKLIATMHNNGNSHKQIAQATGRTRRAVATRLQKIKKDNNGI